MADFLDRLGDELSRAVRTPIDTAAAGGEARRRSRRLRAMITWRPAGAARSSLSARSSVGAIAALAAIAIAAVVVIAANPFASEPRGVSSSEASGSAVAPFTGLGRAGGSAAQKSKPHAHHGPGASFRAEAGPAVGAEAAAPPSIRAQPLSRRQRNRRAARRRARSLLAKLSLPADARRVSADPSTSGGLASAPSPSSPRLVDLHRYWRLRRSPQKTIEWVAEHPPAGSHLRGHGRGAPVLARWTFAYPASSGRLTTVWLVVQVAAAAHGGTAIRADGEAVWARPRAAG